MYFCTCKFFMRLGLIFLILICMGFLGKLFGKNKDKEHKIGGMEDYMTLVRVYLQAAIAENAGITNLAVLPDLRMFKATLHVPTLNNKLGVGEKRHCKKMLVDLYKTDDDFSRNSTRAFAATAVRCRMCRLI